MAEQKKKKSGNRDDLVTIKKYANRRLYNTATSAYVTLDYLAEMVKRGEDFIVVDAKSGEDITRAILTQIIVEEENKGQNMLPINYLRQLISYYGDNLQSFMPSYLEMTMDNFKNNQDSLRARLTDTFGESLTPTYKMFEKAAEQNMKFFEQGLKMWGLPGTSDKAEGASDEEDLEALKRENARLKAKLAERE